MAICPEVSCRASRECCKSLDDQQAELMEGLFYRAYLDFINKEKLKQKEDK
jgi:hypothetical protein